MNILIDLASLLADEVDGAVWTGAISHIQSVAPSRNPS